MGVQIRFQLDSSPTPPFSTVAGYNIIEPTPVVREQFNLATFDFRSIIRALSRTQLSSQL